MGSERGAVCTVAAVRLMFTLDEEQPPSSANAQITSAILFMGTLCPRTLDAARLAWHIPTMKKFDPASLLVPRASAADEGAIIRMAQKSRDLRANGHDV